MGELEGKVVFITGASAGIGAALARRSVAEGARVALVARRTDRIGALADELGKGSAIAFAADVTRDGDLEKAAAGARDAFGSIDVVVANAGFGITGKFASLTIDDFRRQLETNLFGVVRTIYATLPDLERSRGCLVLLGSVSGHMGLPGLTAYTASKFAVRGLAQSLEHELAPKGVGVVLITPGLIETEIRRIDNQGALHEGAKDPAPRWLQMPAEEAAREILEAVSRRERERVLTRHGKLAVALAKHAPGIVAAGVSLSVKMGR
jgi:NADP-dependent 3-hydroxy acid dehydrogenase YdfG